MVRPMTTQANKTVGVLGGMGPGASIDFMSKVVALTPAERDQEHIRMLVDHNPKVPDRRVANDDDRQSVEHVLAEMAERLQTAGADFLVVPCNTAHDFLHTAIKRSNIPFLHIVDETIAAVRQMFPDRSSVGLMAIDNCLQAGMYQKAIGETGLTLQLLPASKQADFMEAVFEIKRCNDYSEYTERMRGLAEILVSQGADVIVAGCTEVPLVIGEGDISVPFVSSTDVLAQRTADICGGDSPLPNK